MSLLPSPIPHPLDYCPWDLPGWIYEALDWVVGVEWPEGNERAVWDLADQWYGVAAVLAGPRDDATSAASEVRSGYGGIGAVAEAFDTVWRRVAEGDEAPLPVLLAVTGELGQLVESCGCDIEGAKLEVWIELGILVVELLSLAVVTVLTVGAASPAAGVAITTTRMVVQQIFKRLMAQLARKALKEGLKEASERAAKEVVKSGVRGFARRAALGGLVEAGQEAGVSLAAQAYQNSTGRRHGLDVADVGMSAAGGFAGGTVAPLAGLGRHANGRFAEIGEHFGREMTGETLAEGAAGLVTGQGASLEDLTRAAVAGGGGATTSQADRALQHRLDGRMTALAGTSLPPTDLTGTAALAPGPDSPGLDTLGQSAVRPAAATPTAGAGPGSEAVSSQVPNQRSGPVAAAMVGTPSVDGHAVLGASAPAVSHPALVASASVAVEPVAVPHSSVTAEAGMTPTLSSAAVDPGLASTVPASVDADPAHPRTSVDSTPLRSAVTAEPLAGPNRAPVAVALPSTGVPGPASQPVAGGAVPVGTEPPRTGGSNTTAGRSPVGTLTTPAVPTSASRPTHVATPAPAVSGRDAGPPVPQQSPSPSPRFPMLEALAPGPPRHTDDASPAFPGPFNPLPPRPRTPEQFVAQRAADREGLDRRRYQGYFEAQRAWFEDKRRHDLAKELREAADQHYEAARWLIRQARELMSSGHHYMADQHRGEARLRERLYHQSLEMAETVLNGSVVPAHLTVEDDADFYRINDDVADLAPGAVETPDRSALTGDDDPPPIDRSRRFGVRGGLRPPLALHQTDLERQMPRNPDGSVVRTADPRYGGWFQLANDGGPQADATRGLNCLDCTLSLYDTWLHGRPRVSAPRTFDGYLEGDVRRPVGGEADGPRRVEEVTGGRFQKLCGETDAATGFGARQAVESGYRDLHEHLLLGGHGSYAFLITSWEGGGSHAWVALNQNGTVLYLDPQNGHVWDRPLYTHDGAVGLVNVVGIDALVLDRDGRPMPLAGRPPGEFSVLPDPPPRPDPSRPPVPPPTPRDAVDDVPDFNHVHLLWEADASASRAQDPIPPGSAAADGFAHLRDSLSPGEMSTLDGLVERAEAAADSVQSELTAIGHRVTARLQLERPVELRDQEFRVKSRASLARKFLDEAAAVGVPVEDFGRQVNDVLRFAFVAPGGDRYQAAVEGVLAELSAAGFAVRDVDCKNFWRAGNRFYGFNCTVRSPGGQLFELQLHSEASRAAWLETHHSYERLRRLDESPSQRVEAFLRMLAINRAHGTPDDVPWELSLRFPAKDATFAKWISVNGAVWQQYLTELRAEGRTFADVVRGYGLTAKDFPIPQEIYGRLGEANVDVLRALPH
ncbi:papain fold toxin 1 (glutamine deamidase) of polymorphic toxin system [Micromonospora kangleipakensis]|uniref:Papain fold toxin 1 (Glutamine deamidase) of polymorphic toxin system n=1 Tax=Micromonospora kangleipakensis TaxID=1077942 RepID=A0A4Q8B6Z0_9ACTN|nr:toxin glutamine deamidase domain-containing protein [Micromonospora kangleipakensis]RZU73414.1 papain fold toxin 1 (glutamine deamidase) of polymorphic toxin system [Micromonospora kangleipakensis]